MNLTPAHVGANPEETAQWFAEWLITQAASAINDHGRFFFAIPGGRSPIPLFELMAQPHWQRRFPWGQTELFWGDERDVLPTHPDSNFAMAERFLLSRLSPAPAAVHRWVTEYDPPRAMADYRWQLHQLPSGGGRFPVLDTILLGLGAEGHVASLFPLSPALDERDVVAHPLVPQMGWRYTLTLPVLQHAHTVAFWVTGAGKADIVSRLKGLKAPTPEVPASLLAELPSVHWFFDRQSAGISL